MSRLAEVRKIHYLLQCSYSGGGGWNIFFFKIEEPINLYHAERHILSEPNMEVCPPPPPPPPLRVHLSIVRLAREPFFIYGGKETMTTYHRDIMTNFSCVHDRSTVYPFF